MILRTGTHAERVAAMQHIISIGKHCAACRQAAPTLIEAYILALRVGRVSTEDIARLCDELNRIYPSDEEELLKRFANRTDLDR